MRRDRRRERDRSRDGARAAPARPSDLRREAAKAEARRISSSSDDRRKRHEASREAGRNAGRDTGRDASRDGRRDSRYAPARDSGSSRKGRAGGRDMPPPPPPGGSPAVNADELRAIAAQRLAAVLPGLPPQLGLLPARPPAGQPPGLALSPPQAAERPAAAQTDVPPLPPPPELTAAGHSPRLRRARSRDPLAQRSPRSPLERAERGGSSRSPQDKADRDKAERERASSRADRDRGAGGKAAAAGALPPPRGAPPPERPHPSEVLRAFLAPKGSAAAGNSPSDDVDPLVDDWMLGVPPARTASLPSARSPAQNVPPPPPVVPRLELAAAVAAPGTARDQSWAQCRVVHNGRDKPRDAKRSRSQEAPAGREAGRENGHGGGGRSGRDSRHGGDSRSGRERERDRDRDGRRGRCAAAQPPSTGEPSAPLEFS